MVADVLHENGVRLERPNPTPVQREFPVGLGTVGIACRLAEDVVSDVLDHLGVHCKRRDAVATSRPLPVVLVLQVNRIAELHAQSRTKK